MNIKVSTLDDVVEAASLLLTGTFDGVLVTKPDVDNAEILYANDAFSKLTGYTAEELIGQTPKVFQGPKTNPKIMERLKAELSAGRNFRGAAVNYRKDGSEYHADWKINVVFDEQGKPLCFLSIQRDLSYVKSFLSRLKSSTVAFRELLHEVCHMNADAKQSLSEDTVKNATKEEIQNMALFSADLRKEEDVELFDSELFIDESFEMGVMPEQQYTSAISALEYAQTGAISSEDILQLCSIIEESLNTVELLKSSTNPQSSFKTLLKDFEEFNATVFLMYEFTNISTVLGQLINTLAKKNADQIEEFMIDTLQAIILDLNDWVTSVFLNKDADNIHKYDACIISSAKQLIFMLD
jgi:PAS domain S-box-containing protein